MLHQRTSVFQCHWLVTAQTSMLAHICIVSDIETAILSSFDVAWYMHLSHLHCNSYSQTRWSTGPSDLHILPSCENLHEAVFY